MAVLTVFLAFSAAADHPPVRSAAEINYPPFSVVDAQGRADGFSVELIRAAINAMGRDVTFRTGPWSEVRGWLEQGEVQALPLVGRTPEREALFDFTFPYMTLFGAIVVRTDTEGIDRIEDLAGRRVAVMRGDNAEEFLRREERGIDIHATHTFEEALRELSEGRHDAVVMQHLVAVRLLNETGLGNLRILNRPIEDFRQDFCFAVTKGDAATLALLNEGLSLVIADGTFRRLHVRWFSSLEIPANRRIIVGGDHAFPPFEFLDSRGRPAGFTVEITRAIAREMGLDIEIRLGPWSDIVRALERGEIDAIQGMFYTEERDRIFDFSQRYLVAQYVSIVADGFGRAPETLPELQGRRVVVQADDVMHGYLVEQGLGEGLMLTDTQEDMLRAVAEGRADVALAFRMSALHFIEKNGWTHLSTGRRPFHSLDYAFAVPVGKRALLAEFGEGIRSIELSGEYRRIHEQWLGIVEYPLTLRRILWYAGWIAGSAAVVLFGVFLWISLLRRQVAHRTREIRESEARFRLLAEAAPVGIVVSDAEQRCLFVNRSFVDMFGYTLQDMPTLEEWWPLAYPDESFRRELRAKWNAGVEEAMRTHREIKPIDAPVRCKDGSIRQIDFRMASTGAMNFVLMTDITQRKQDEARIGHLNRVLKAIRDINQLIVREQDRQSLIHECCRLLVEHRGYVSAVVALTDAGQRITDWAGAGMAVQTESFTALLERGEWPACFRQVPTAGNVVVIDDRRLICSGCPFVGPCGKTLSFCMRLLHEGVEYGHLAVALGTDAVVDAEERDLLEEVAGDLAYALHNVALEERRAAGEKQRAVLREQLDQAQKLESIGRLAGGVAHDFNNLLMAILGNVELCREKLPADAPALEFLDEINHSAERSADLTRQLLAFARKQAIAPRVLELNDTIMGMLKLLRRLLGEDIELAWIPGHDVWPVVMDPSQIDQILANLCVNARDAIAGVGTLTIETQNVSLDAAACEGKDDAVPGDYVVLAVSDSGCGIERELLDHIFEPFFTTKRRGEGTGLGLATVYGIAKQNRGFVHVYSEKGKGSTFRIYLPRSAEGADAVEAELEVAAPPRGSGTILLVEDEPAIRTVVVRLLESLGYTVHAASGPVNALRMAAEPGAVIDLLLTDVIMPDMSGRDLADRLREQRPGLPILYMSGYTANVIAHHGVLDEGVEFLQKPVTRMALALKVHALVHPS